MGGYALIDADGWVSGMVIAEAEFDSSRYSCHHAVEIPEEEARRLSKNYLHTFHDGSKFQQINDRKEIWKRLKISGIPNRLIQHELAKHLENIIYPTATIQLPVPIIEQKQFNTADFEMEILPNLKIAHCDETDIDILEAHMVASGIYTSKDAWFQASQWILSSRAWAVKVEWQGNPIQIEIFSFNQDSHALNGEFAVHIDRTRPLWFWRQMSKPVLKALYAHGFEQINSLVRTDKQEYAQFLSNAYGHEILKQTQFGYKMRLYIKDALAKIGTWPQRRTMGAGWTWQRDGVTIREADQTDAPALLNAINVDWSTNPRKAMILKRLNDSWKLDAATVLLALENGNIINARLYRERMDTTINLAFFPLHGVATIGSITVNQQAALDGFDAWMKGVGYKKTSFIIETPLYVSVWENRGWKIVKQDAELTEAERDIP